MRFDSAEAEAAFRDSCEKQLFFPFIIACIFALVTLGSVWPERLIQEIAREDRPFAWDKADPRSIPFGVAMVNFAVGLALVVLTCASWCDRIRMPCSWEYIVAGAAVFVEVSYFFMSTWHMSVMHKQLPEDVWPTLSSIHAESYTLFALMGTVMTVCMCMPVRSHILWVVPLAAVLAYTFILSTVGSCFPDPWYRTLPTLAFVCAIQFHSARRHEQHVRKKWLAVRRVEEQDTELQNAASLARALSAMAGTLSDVVLMLGSDLGIMNTGNDLAAYFGKQVAGSTLKDLLLPEDQPRFDHIVSEAVSSGIMQSMPTSIELEFATLQVQLVLVATGSRAPYFIAGLHTVGHTPAQEGVLSPEICGMVDYKSECEEPRFEDGTSELGSVCGKTRLESVASTTITGRVFANLDEVGFTKSSELALPQVLGRIAEMGLREHWLFRTDELSLLPDRILGKGGFGVVIMACLRGTPVAAKLPRDIHCARNMWQLSSVANELRVHRHVRHSNIALFYGACIDPLSGSIALIYEQIQGTPLDKFVETSLTSDDDVLRTKLCLDIAAAIGYLHAWAPPIVHGDLKPSNVLVEDMRSCPRAKVLDFGLSRLITKKAKPLGGTPSWMAPELLVQCTPPPRPAPAADVFSFGMVVYFVVVGRLPVKSLEKPSPNMVSLPLVWPGRSELESAGRECCEACLSFDPARRPHMSTVQSWLLLWLPEAPQRLQRLDRSTLSLLLGSVAWEAGMAQLRRAGLGGGSLGEEPKELNDPAPEKAQTALGGDGAGLCTWLEEGEDMESSRRTPEKKSDANEEQNCSRTTGSGSGMNARDGPAKYSL